MPSLKLYNLVALATVAIVASSFNAEPVQALATSQRLYANSVVKSHHAIAKQKRSSKGKRCRPKNNGNTTTGNSGGSTSSGSESSSGDNQGSTNTDTDSNSNSSSDGNNADQGSDNGDQVSTGGSGTEATTTAPPAGQTTTSAPPADQTTSTPPTDSTTTSAPPAGTPPATGGSKSGKVCLAWPIGNDPSLANFETSNSGVLYTWGPDMPANLHGYKAAPMLWSDGGIADFQAKVKPGSAEFILGFNEPEMAGGQANMTPERAAQVWKDVIQPLAGPNTKLISPAVTNAPQSKPWLQSFMDKCTDCKVDAVSVHFYGTKAENLIDYITDFHNTFKKPVWLTEYACQDFGPQPQHQCTVEETKQFMDTVKAFAEANDWVEQYCWFGAMHDMGNVNPVNQLLGADGKPTALGVDFLGL